MREFLTSLLERTIEKLKKRERQEAVLEEYNGDKENQPRIKTSLKKKKTQITKHYKENPARDLMEIMEVPFLALSKNRKSPIIYESPDGKIKIKVSRHTGHFLASIYDWDIILFAASKMQEILNSSSDIPPRTLVIPRHELLKSINKRNVNTQQKQLEASLQRLRRTAIDTTIRNEDYRYKADFGFIDSWDYTERKDIKEIRITFSQWLYDGICAKGALLKVDSAYFCLTSGLKKFLYRTARKHAGKSDDYWEFSIEKLYKKSGSEREFKKFKSDLKTAVIANDIPDYAMKWIQKGRKSFVAFSNSKIEKLEQMLEKFESNHKGENCDIQTNHHEK